MKPQSKKKCISVAFSILLSASLAMGATATPAVPVPSTILISALPDIERDDLRAAMETFERSCTKYLALGKDKPIAPGYTGARLAPNYTKLMLACADASALLQSHADSPTLLAMLDKYFEAVEAVPDKGTSLLTAYYEPTFLISKEKIAGELDWPLYSKPKNMPAGAWFSRQEIESGQAAQELQEQILCYTDRWAAYVLQIQGSGVGLLPDGSQVRLTYSGKNGWPYASVGKALVERGDIAADKISMQAIKGWLNMNSREQQDLLYWRNQSYVFFSIDDRPAVGRVGPPGAMNLDVGLTPNRSVAVDWTHFIPGMPLFIKGTLGNGQTLSRLVIAQDRGGAITSKVRVDLFLGAGNEAEDTAGATRDENLRLWTLQFRN